MEIKQIRHRLTERVKGSVPIGGKLKFRLDNDIILIDGTGDSNIISGNNENADCTMIMSLETYIKIQRSEIKPFKAMLTGKMKVQGDVGLARKFGQIT